jgi:hypothetical protein
VNAAALGELAVAARLWETQRVGRRIGGLSVVIFAVVATGARAAPPSFVFTQTPHDPTNQTSAMFAWAGTAPFTCSLDGAAFQACSSPTTVSGLSEGAHEFKVEEASSAGAPPTITDDWTVDLTPPTTVVTQKPPPLSNSSTATFAFNSPDPTATFQCSLNGSPAQACTSPVVYSGLADATRTLLIQAVDPAGNVDVLAQPITWTVDTTPPDTALANPGNIVGSVDPVFKFTATEAGSTFQCSFNNAPFAACVSPFLVDVPGSGPQKFSVRAVDGAGNVDPTPAVYAWTSDLTPPKRPKVTIFPAPPAAKASSAAPVVRAGPTPGLGLTFTNPLAKLLNTPTFTLSTRLQAQWKSDASAVSYDVTVQTLPDDSTGMDERGDDVLMIKQYIRTKRTALRLALFRGTTVCVKVDARDKVGNVSAPRTSCTTIPDSFAPPWGPYGFQRARDPQAWRGYYIVLPKDNYLEQQVGDSAFFSPSSAGLIAERCPDCGAVELAFTKFPVGGHPFRDLATVNLTGKTDHQVVIDINLPRRRLERDGDGYVVLLRLSGKPRISGVGFTS